MSSEPWCENEKCQMWVEQDNEEISSWEEWSRWGTFDAYKVHRFGGSAVVSRQGQDKILCPCIDCKEKIDYFAE